MMQINPRSIHMGIAERIYEIAKQLPEAEASEVLHFIESKHAKAPPQDAAARRAAALAVLDKYAGRVKVVKFKRDELYDRPILR